MVYRKISEDIKERTVYLMGELFDYTPDELAFIFLVSSRSIYRWTAQVAATGTFNPPSELTRGRPSLLSPEVRAELASLLRDEPTLFLDEIAEWLAIVHDALMALGALCDAIKNMALTRKQVRRTASQRDEPLRTEFMPRMRRMYRRDQLIFGDETSKDGRTIYRRYGRAQSGHRAVDSQPFERGVRWSILPVMNMNGYMTTRFIEGAVDGETFFDFIVEDVVSLL